MKYGADIQRQSGVYHGPHGRSGLKVPSSIDVRGLGRTQV